MCSCLRADKGKENNMPKAGKGKGPRDFHTESDLFSRAEKEEGFGASKVKRRESEFSPFINPGTKVTTMG